MRDAVRHHVHDHYLWRVIGPDKLGRRLAIAPEAAVAHAFEIFAD